MPIWSTPPSRHLTSIYLSIRPALRPPLQPHPPACFSSSSICILLAGRLPLCRPAADHARMSVLQMFTIFTQMLWRGHSTIKSQEVVAEFWPSTVLPHKMKDELQYSSHRYNRLHQSWGGGGGVFHPLCWIMRSHSIMCPSTAELCLWKWKLTRSLKQGDLPTWMSRGCRNLFLCCPKQKNLDEAGGGSTEKKPSRIERWLA